MSSSFYKHVQFPLIQPSRSIDRSNFILVSVFSSCGLSDEHCSDGEDGAEARVLVNTTLTTLTPFISSRRKFSRVFSVQDGLKVLLSLRVLTGHSRSTGTTPVWFSTVLVLFVSIEQVFRCVWWLNWMTVSTHVSWLVKTENKKSFCKKDEESDWTLTADSFKHRQSFTDYYGGDSVFVPLSLLVDVLCSSQE